MKTTCPFFSSSMWICCTLLSPKQVKFPSRETVFDYWLDPETGSFEQWTKRPYFFSIDYDSRVTPMTQVHRCVLKLTVPGAETLC